MPNSSISDRKIDDDFALHVVRNPYGWSEETIRSCRLYVCDKLESYKDAYINLRDFAEENGLDTMIYR
jgi:hypothetical protein